MGIEIVTPTISQRECSDNSEWHGWIGETVGCDPYRTGCIYFRIMKAGK